MRTLATMCVAAAASLLLASCNPPEVVQGTVVSVDADGQELVLRDEQPPNDEREYSIVDAALHEQPAVGDEVRIAYRQVGDTRVATRVMNVNQSVASRSTDDAQ